MTEASLSRSAPIDAWPSDLRDDLGRDWERVFDLDAYPDEEYWQATVEEVYASDVVAAVSPVTLPRRRTDTGHSVAATI